MRLKRGDQISIRKKIQEAGMRVTLPRLQILYLLEQLRGHHSVDELHEELDRRGVLLPQASVYNALHDFTRAGLAREAETGLSKAVYELTGDAHHHFVCSGCRRIVDVPCSGQDQPCLGAQLPGFDIQESQVIFRGFCPDCRMTETNPD